MGTVRVWMGSRDASSLAVREFRVVGSLYARDSSPCTNVESRRARTCVTEQDIVIIMLESRVNLVVPLYPETSSNFFLAHAVSVDVCTRDASVRQSRLPGSVVVVDQKGNADLGKSTPSHHPPPSRLCRISPFQAERSTAPTPKTRDRLCVGPLFSLLYQIRD